MRPLRPAARMHRRCRSRRHHSLVAPLTASWQTVPAWFTSNRNRPSGVTASQAARRTCSCVPASCLTAPNTPFDSTAARRLGWRLIRTAPSDRHRSGNRGDRPRPCLARADPLSVSGKCAGRCRKRRHRRYCVDAPPPISAASSSCNFFSRSFRSRSRSCQR